MKPWHLVAIGVAAAAVWWYMKRNGTALPTAAGVPRAAVNVPSAPAPVTGAPQPSVAV